MNPMIFLYLLLCCLAVVDNNEVHLAGHLPHGPEPAAPAVPALH